MRNRLNVAAAGTSLFPRVMMVSRVNDMGSGSAQVNSAQTLAQLSEIFVSEVDGLQRPNLDVKALVERLHMFELGPLQHQCATDIYEEHGNRRIALHAHERGRILGINLGELQCAFARL